MDVLLNLHFKIKQFAQGRQVSKLMCGARFKKVGFLNMKYSGPSILRPPMGPRRCGLILQVVLK